MVGDVKKLFIDGKMQLVVIAAYVGKEEVSVFIQNDPMEFEVIVKKDRLAV